MSKLSSFVWFVVCAMIAMVGFHIHHSFFWSIVDFLFAPLPFIKWLIYQEVSWRVIQDTFRFFFV